MEENKVKNNIVLVFKIIDQCNTDTFTNIYSFYAFNRKQRNGELIKRWYRFGWRWCKHRKYLKILRDADDHNDLRVIKIPHKEKINYIRYYENKLIKIGEYNNQLNYTMIFFLVNLYYPFPEEIQNKMSYGMDKPSFYEFLVICPNNNLSAIIKQISNIYNGKL